MEIEAKALSNEDCLRELAQALLRFQFIEEGMRLYLKRAYMVTQYTTKRKLTVRFSLKDLKRKTLRPLLNEFKKFNGNDDLIRDIDRLIDKRNDLAHRAFFEMYDQLLDGEDLSALRSNALETADQAGKCVEKLIQEIHSIEDLCEKEGLITKMPATKNKRNGTF